MRGQERAPASVHYYPSFQENEFSFFLSVGRKETSYLSVLHSSLTGSGVNKCKVVSGKPNQMSSSWIKPGVTGMLENPSPSGKPVDFKIIVSNLSPF